MYNFLVWTLKIQKCLLKKPTNPNPKYLCLKLLVQTNFQCTLSGLLACPNLHFSCVLTVLLSFWTSPHCYLPASPLTQETDSWVSLSSSKKHFCHQQGACAAGFHTGCCLSWMEITGGFVSSSLNQEILTNVPVHEEGNVCGLSNQHEVIHNCSKQ